MRFGFHVSITGRIHKAIERAKALDCDCLQIFSRNPIDWKRAKHLTEDIIRFVNLRKEAKISPLVVHIPYVVNLASPEDALYKKSIQAFKQDLKYAEILQAEFFVTHLGSHKGKGRESGIKRFGQALKKILEETNTRIPVLLENTAGSGDYLGGSFEEIAEIIGKVGERKSLLGLCFDTCHAFAAGYDLATAEGLETTLKEIEQLIGLEKLKLLHLNDAKSDCSSHIDRHEDIGKGKIGIDGFRRVVNHPKLRDLPAILETPKMNFEDDKRNMKVIRSLYAEISF
ncbi:MAG: deoxyribonuclease IV [Candidatus Edwardsbacteria bacterium]